MSDFIVTYRPAPRLDVPKLPRNERFGSSPFQRMSELCKRIILDEVTVVWSYIVNFQKCHKILGLTRFDEIFENLLTSNGCNFVENCPLAKFRHALERAWAETFISGEFWYFFITLQLQKYYIFFCKIFIKNLNFFSFSIVFSIFIDSIQQPKSFSRRKGKLNFPTTKKLSPNSSYKNMNTSG